ncbi:tetratricopeptide repeat protein [Achromobacter kerstersii]|uniref:tetratricopeptide repeat protein n=1 Tax=Achromobacter kerstersii TaxID=1353890 RepID=UPI0006C4B5A0|nr:tetratricopeptide repeat protein [Achromobacter kerstersii]CUJ59239.1 type IV pilus biogenesis/stability protein PilW [Achromobacter kerstersii]
MITRLSLFKAAAAMLAGASMSLSAFAASAPDGLDQGIRALQNDWAVIQYQTPANQRETRFEALSQQAHALTERFAAKAEPHIWEGIILSSWAGAKGGLGALGLAKQAKAEYETAIQIDSKALGGSALNSLGVLYYKVPGWPVGFGDNKKAEALLQQALAINPDGIDANYFYADYLIYRNRKPEAIPYLEKALKAPPRPGREVADAGRKQEARALLESVR